MNTETNNKKPAFFKTIIALAGGSLAVMLALNFFIAPNKDDLKAFISGGVNYCCFDADSNAQSPFFSSGACVFPTNASVCTASAPTTLNIDPPDASIASRGAKVFTRKGSATGTGTWSISNNVCNVSPSNSPATESITTVTCNNTTPNNITGIILTLEVGDEIARANIIALAQGTQPPPGDYDCDNIASDPNIPIGMPALRQLNLSRNPWGTKESNLGTVVTFVTNNATFCRNATARVACNFGDTGNAWDDCDELHIKRNINHSEVGCGGCSSPTCTSAWPIACQSALKGSLCETMQIFTYCDPNAVDKKCFSYPDNYSDKKLCTLGESGTINGVNYNECEPEGTQPAHIDKCLQIMTFRIVPEEIDSGGTTTATRGGLKTGNATMTIDNSICKFTSGTGADQTRTTSGPGESLEISCTNSNSSEKTVNVTLTHEDDSIAPITKTITVGPAGVKTISVEPGNTSISSGSSAVFYRRGTVSGAGEWSLSGASSICSLSATDSSGPDTSVTVSCTNNKVADATVTLTITVGSDSASATITVPKEEAKTLTISPSTQTVSQSTSSIKFNRGGTATGDSDWSLSSTDCNIDSSTNNNQAVVTCSHTTSLVEVTLTLKVGTDSVEAKITVMPATAKSLVLAVAPDTLSYTGGTITASREGDYEGAATMTIGGGTICSFPNGSQIYNTTSNADVIITCGTNTDITEKTLTISLKDSSGNDATNSPKTITIGAGLVPGELSISPTSKNFKAFANATTEEQIFTISNGDSSPHTINRVEILGDTGNHFEYQDMDCNGKTLAPGGTCQVKVVYKPNTKGNHSASLKVSSATKDVSATLTGEATTANLIIDPGSATIEPGGNATFTRKGDSTSPGTWTLPSGSGCSFSSTTSQLSAPSTSGSPPNSVTVYCENRTNASKNIPLTLTLDDGASATATITVSASNITITPDSASMGNGGSATFTRGGNATGPATWSVGAGCTLSTTTSTAVGDSVTVSCNNTSGEDMTATLTLTLNNSDVSATATINVRSATLSISPGGGNAIDSGKYSVINSREKYTLTRTGDAIGDATWIVDQSSHCIITPTPPEYYMGNHFPADEDNIPGAGDTATIVCTNLTGEPIDVIVRLVLNNTNLDTMMIIKVNPENFLLSPCNATINSRGSVTFTQISSMVGDITWVIDNDYCHFNHNGEQVQSMVIPNSKSGDSQTITCINQTGGPVTSRVLVTLYHVDEDEFINNIQSEAMVTINSEGLSIHPTEVEMNSNESRTFVREGSASGLAFWYVDNSNCTINPRESYKATDSTLLTCANKTGEEYSATVYLALVGDGVDMSDIGNVYINACPWSGSSGGGSSSGGSSSSSSGGSSSSSGGGTTSGGGSSSGGGTTSGGGSNIGGGVASEGAVSLFATASVKVKAEEIKIAPISGTINSGKSFTLTRQGNSTGKAIWSVDMSDCTIEPATSLNRGDTALLTCINTTSRDFEATVSLTLEDGNIEAVPAVITVLQEDITISPDKSAINSGESATFVRQGSGTGIATWSVDNSNCSVDPVVSEKTGDSTKVICQNKTGEKLTVNVSLTAEGTSTLVATATLDVNPEIIKIEPETATINSYENITLTREGSAKGPARWVVDNSNCSLVDPLQAISNQAGDYVQIRCENVTGKNVTANVSLVLEGTNTEAAKAIITINPAELTIAPKEATINSGESVTLTHQGDGRGDATWSVDNSNCKFDNGQNTKRVADSKSGDAETVTCTNNTGTQFKAIVHLTIDGTNISPGNKEAISTITVNPAELTITPKEVTINSNESITLTQQGDGKGDATWSVDNSNCKFDNGQSTKKATDSKSGDTETVTCINKTGTQFKAIVRLTIDGTNVSPGNKEAQATITVNPEALTITPNSATINSGESITLIQQGNAKGDVVWMIDNSNCYFGVEGTQTVQRFYRPDDINNNAAKSGDSVTVTCKNQNKNNITANVFLALVDGVNAEAVITKAISTITVNPETLTIIPNSATINSGESITFTQEGNAQGNATWSVDNSNCKFENGTTIKKLSASQSGDTATVTCVNQTGSSFTAKINLLIDGTEVSTGAVANLIVNSETLSITPNTMTVNAGKSATLTRSGNALGNGTWTVSDEHNCALNTTTSDRSGNAVTITCENNTGNPLNVDVTLTLDSTSTFAKASLIINPSELEITPSSATINSGEALNLIRQGDAHGLATWSVDNSNCTLNPVNSVDSGDSTSVVCYNKTTVPLIANVYLTMNGTSTRAVANITVNPENISISPNSVTINSDQSATLTRQGSAKGKATWSVDNSNCTLSITESVESGDTTRVYCKNNTDNSFTAVVNLTLNETPTHAAVASITVNPTKLLISPNTISINSDESATLTRQGSATGSATWSVDNSNCKISVSPAGSNLGNNTDANDDNLEGAGDTATINCINDTGMPYTAVVTLTLNNTVIFTTATVIVNPSELFIAPNSITINSDESATLTRQGNALGGATWSVDNNNCTLDPNVSNMSGDTTVITCTNKTTSSYTAIVTLTMNGTATNEQAVATITVNPSSLYILPPSANLTSNSGFIFTRQGDAPGPATWSLNNSKCGLSTRHSSQAGDETIVTCTNDTDSPLDVTLYLIVDGTEDNIAEANITVSPRNVFGLSGLHHFPLRVSGIFDKYDAIAYVDGAFIIGTDKPAQKNYAKENHLIFNVENGSGLFNVQLENKEFGEIGDPKEIAMCSDNGLGGTVCNGLNSFYFESANKEGSVNIIIRDNNPTFALNDYVITLHILPPAIRDIIISNKSYVDITAPLQIKREDELQLYSKNLLFDDSVERGTENKVTWEFLYVGEADWSTSNEKATLENGLFKPMVNGTFRIRTKITQTIATAGEQELGYRAEEIMSLRTVTVVVDEAPPEIISVRTTGNASAAKGTHDTLYIEISNVAGIAELDHMEISLVNGSYATPDSIPTSAQTFDIIESGINPKFGFENDIALLQVPIFIPELNDIKDGPHTILIKVFNKSDKVARAVYPINIGIPARGDANGDGKLSLLDAILVMKFYSGSATPTSLQFNSIDFNNNGKIELIDVIGVFRIIIDNQQGTNPFTACTRVEPTVLVTPTMQNGAPGEIYNYTITIINRNTNSCGVDNYAISVDDLPASITPVLSKNSINIASGVSSNVELKLNTQNATPLGNIEFKISANSGMQSAVGIGQLSLHGVCENGRCEADETVASCPQDCR